MTKQEIEKAQQIINHYLSSLKTESDKLTQFYSACKIAEIALSHLKSKI